MARPAATLARPPVAVAVAGSAVVAVGLFALLDLVGLGAAGWAGGGTFLALAAAMVSRAARQAGAASLGPAGTVTALRAVLTGGVAALVVEDLARPGAVGATPLVALAVVALVLDGVDGLVARRTRTASELGARFDSELDAALLAVLSVHVATDLGVWVLAVGAMRYAFVAAGWALPWLRGSLPVRRSAKVVAVAQGVALAVASADALPRPAAVAVVAAALAALTWSFGVSMVWLARQRPAAHGEGSIRSLHRPEGSPRASGAGRWRTAAGAALTVVAVLVLGLVLVAPQDGSGLLPEPYLRLPVEGVAGLALLVLLPARARRPLALAAGALLGAWAVLTAFDVGFATVLARPFDPVLDRALVADAAEFVGSTYGPGARVAAVVGAVVLGVVLLVGGALAARWVVTRAAARRRVVLRALGVLGAVWLVAAVAGTTTAPGVRLAAASTAAGVAGRAELTAASLRDADAFAAQSRADAWADTPPADLLTALRGKDVVLAIVESYGRAALTDPGLAPTVTPVLERADRELPAAGWGARSGFLTSSVVGSGSWLAHATLLSGLRVDNQQRYLTLTSSDRSTLSVAFRRAGWDTAAVQPGTTRAWPEGTFYGYDRAYDVRDLGYRGPVLRLGLDARPVRARPRRPPRARPAPPAAADHGRGRPGLQPRAVDPAAAHGRVGRRSATARSSPARPRRPPGTPAARRGCAPSYAGSIAYTLDALTSWVAALGRPGPRAWSSSATTSPRPWSPARRGPRRAGLGRHPRPGRARPHRGLGLDRPGCDPDPGAPTWPMEAFRDRFLGAYSPR